VADIRQVTPNFSVAPQIGPDDFAALAALGFKSIINNRPDGESAADIQDAQARAGAAAAGLTYRAIPFAGAPGPGQIEATEKALAELPGPVLAYCRSGTRSVTAWALAQARAGTLGADEIITLARGAGYDLAGLKGALTAARG
jgi:uncharacterized protein (TIGR01244 family)